MIDVSGAQPTPPVAKSKPELASMDDSAHLQEIMPALLVVIVAVAALVVFFLSQSYAQQATREQNQYASLSAELKTGPLADAATQANQLAGALRVLNQASTNQRIWSKLLQNIQVTIQPGITLSNLSVDQKNSLKLEGIADSYTGVATYLATLRSSPFISQVDLVSAQLADTGNGQVNFSLDVQVKSDQLRATVATPAPSTNGGGQ